MDPFSVTLGVITLATLSSRAGVELKKLRKGAVDVDKIDATLADLRSLKTVLASIEDGFEDLDSSAPLTGDVGAHFLALKKMLNDGCGGMDKLVNLLVGVNREVKLLDAAQRRVRFRAASTQIVLYRQEMQAYKDALQLSYQSVSLFQQTLDKADTSSILNKYESLHHDLSRLAANLEVKLTALEMMLPERSRSTGATVASVKHLRTCVTTATIVVKSASAVLSDAANDQSAEIWDISSEFGWLLKDTTFRSDLKRDWFSSKSSERPASLVTTFSIGDKVKRRPSVPLASSSTNISIHDIGIGIGIHPAAVVGKSASSLKLPRTPNIRQQPSRISLKEKPRKRKRRGLIVLKTLIRRPKEIARPKGTAKPVEAPTPVEAETLVEVENPRETAESQSKDPNALQPELRMKRLKIDPSGDIRMKFNFVGDGACGKTCFLLHTTEGAYPRVYIPTVFENYLAGFAVRGVRFECALWDTAGQEDFDRLRPLSYPDTHIYCICFAIDSPDSLENVELKWMPEINNFRRKKDPVFLLGFKKDLRYDHRALEALRRKNQRPTTFSDGERMARKIGAVRYMECSAKTHEDTRDVFRTMLTLVLDGNPELERRYKDGAPPKRKGLDRAICF